MIGLDGETKAPRLVQCLIHYFQDVCDRSPLLGELYHIGQVHREPPVNRLVEALADSTVIAKRNMIKIKRVPEVLVFVLLSPIMFVLLFAYVFGNSIDVPGGDYREFLIAGIFAQTVLFGATFPGGSITGAPKIRAMEIIAEIEKAPRGVYCGSIGYIGFNGKTDFNIAIRTAQFAGGIARVQGGGGITARSHPQAEYEESLTKIRRIMEAFKP